MDILPIAAAVVASALTWAFNEHSNREKQKHRVRSNKEALLVEARLCREHLCRYLDDIVNTFKKSNALPNTPMFRLPTVSYTAAFPPLLADGELRSKDTKAVCDFFLVVGALNNCFDHYTSAQADVVSYSLQLISQEDVKKRGKDLAAIYSGNVRIPASVTKFDKIEIALEQHRPPCCTLHDMQ